MDTMFRDKVLTCAECGNEFVYTVGQQRMAQQSGGAPAEPTLCPVCAVKLERMGRQALAASQPSEPEIPPTSNGRAYPHEEAFQPAYSHPPYPLEGAGSPLEEIASRISPNRPADYRSGLEHPLHGHGGETFLGHVKWFNDRKGFGFIVLDSGLEIFVHYSGILGDGYKTLKQDQRVSITVEDTGKGPQATNVMVVGEEESGTRLGDTSPEAEPVNDSLPDDSA